MTISIIPIPAFNDNYIWCYQNSKTNNCFVVDPGDAKPVLDYLKKYNLTLTDILITHHHYDHTAGVKKLREAIGAKVYGPKSSPFNDIDVGVTEGDLIELNSVKASVKVLEVPGHTLDHVAYYNCELVFCGDTLFSGGCGRLFEGNAEQMYLSLMKLKNLDKTTKVYCTHEYTLSNLKFAAALEPNNSNLMNYMKKAKDLRQQNQPTLPSTIALECDINPFLRSEHDEIINHVEQYKGKKLNSKIEVFAAMRAWKDEF